MFLFVLTSLLQLSSPAGPASTPAQTLTVRATTIDGQSLEGAWSGMDSAGAVLLRAGDDTQPIQLADLMSLRFADPAATRPAADRLPCIIHLSDGSHFPARILAGGPRDLELQTMPLPHLKLPLASLAAIRFSAAESPAADEAFRAALADRDTAEDVLLLVRDGRIAALRGAIESLAPDSGAFRWRERSIPIRPEGTCAVILAVGARRPAPPPAVCFLQDGSAWAGRIARADAANITLQLTTGAELPLPLAGLSEVRFTSDRLVFLSDLEPAGYQFDPFGTTRWPWRRDRSVANRPLRIAGQTFERGIGMHVQSRLLYDLPAGLASLAATVGIDDAARPRGRVIFRVLADDREAFTSGPLSGRDPPRAILVPLNGAKRLQLAVDFADELDIGGQADWGNVRLIK